MDLDEIDPAQWALLEAATDAYIVQEDMRFDELCRLLLHNLLPQGPTQPSAIRLGGCQ